MRRIAILGFGFAGNLTLAHLVRHCAPLEIYLIDPRLDGRGVAYSTPYPQHLLNVRANNMSAFPDAPEDFVRWLGTQQLPYGPTDFVPRMVYGQYLDHIFEQSQAWAAQHGHGLKLVPSVAVAVTSGAELAVLTERGDAIAVDRIVLAMGNEFKPMPSNIPMVQNPWEAGALQEAAASPGPILLLGSGLTAVDVLLALRAEGYAGEVQMRSRRKLLPQAHRDTSAANPYAPETLEPLQGLAAWRHWLRVQTRHCTNWRNVVDGLRPFTQAAWQRFSPVEQQRFFARLATYWSVHRHRMAPQIAAQVEAEFAQGSLRWAGGEGAVLAINCTGPQLEVAKSARPLMNHLLAQGLIEPHATSIGIAVDPQHRVWGGAYPNLYAIGSLMTGQLLESTAVPELRVQAQTIAEALCK